MMRAPLRNIFVRGFAMLSAASLAVYLAGCVGRSQVSDYHLLTARADASAAAPLNASIGVGPVRIAQFLDRTQIVTHAGGSALQFRDGERWGEPLEQGVQRVLAQNLAALTGAETRNFPWRQNVTPDYAVRVEIVDLDKLADGSYLLEAGWVVEDLKNSAVVKTQQEKFTLRAAPSATLAQAYSELLAQLAQRIAAQLPSRG